MPIATLQLPQHGKFLAATVILETDRRDARANYDAATPLLDARSGLGRMTLGS